MNKVNNMIKENSDLKGELSGLMELVKENEAKHAGFKAVEFAFLLADSLKEVIEKPLRYLEDIFGVDRAVLFINADELDFDREENNLGYRIYFMPEGVFKTFFLEKRPYNSDNALNLISEFNVYEDMGSYIFAPLVQNDKIIGSINLYSRDESKFGGEVATNFIKDLASIASVSMQKLYNTELIYRQTRTDFMTGAYNKLAMGEFLERFMAKYKRHDQGFIFILMDIDNFKQINDSAGHLTGDTIIKEISDEIAEGLRSSDILGRFGGDEFFMIVPYANIDNVFVLVERLQDIGKQVFGAYGFGDVASLSGGVVSVPGDISKDDTTEDIVRLADGRLYHSKKNGKGFFTGV
ncbi:diguanylate cyclase [Denitrovibrio acetiphilus DSM 12809]|uniref:diguanylate cyclase n=1 Tax=Denitrovibrio acetiphilus (strain DSM 12809 / NBRC 114555 / N2460) TaxID=522772 RepID=D4H3C3_DENA2|nr:GGDEF domain-containing protein [Denitrovibrio acetiphilus]ADD67207.1 diguanylate cyclase [Denitrovibrio acetiphilus DSM 12809]